MIRHHPTVSEAVHGQWGAGGTSKVKDPSDIHGLRFFLGRPLLGTGYGAAWQMNQSLPAK